MADDTHTATRAGTEHIAASRRLATVMKDSPQYKRLIGAQRRLEEDGEATRVYSEYQKAVRHLESLQQWGGAKQEDVAKVEALQKQLLANGIIAEFLTAQDELVQLLQETNGVISERLEVDFARLAKPAKGCC